MNRILKSFAGITTVLVTLCTSVSCNKKSSDKKSSADIPPETTVSTTEPVTEDPDKMTITWLGDFDLNPAPGSPRSTALSLFEDQYGGKINYIRSTPGENISILDSMTASGEELDIFRNIFRRELSRIALSLLTLISISLSMTRSYGKVYPPLPRRSPITDSITLFPTQ